MAQNDGLSERWLIFTILVRGFTALLVASALGGAMVLVDSDRPYLRSSTPAVVDIAPGTNSASIAKLLEDSGAIRSHWTFLALRLLNRRKILKAGIYSFERPLSPQEIMRELVNGEVARQELTIPEGSNRFDIAALLEEGNIVSRDEFLKVTADPALIADLDPAAPSLEGYLFPDTYEFPRHRGAAPIARMMVSRFRQVYSGIAMATVEKTPREIVTLASLVEAETGNANERPVVASVFNNRLKRGVPLQCDPTVVYAAILQNTYKGAIRQVDLNSNSPFNTYAHAGLPPGPITNPGKASLLAALHPATTKYLYFVANATGHHTFSRTLAEHNLAVTLYRRGLPR